MNILVADDDPTSRLVTRIALRRLGHECETVADGRQAWDAYRFLRPDVVISDWVMPGLTGLQLCQDIRAETTDSYTYFILATSRDAPAQILSGMNAGADDHLAKPLDPNELHACLIAAARVTSLHSLLGRQKIELQGLNQQLTAMSRRDPLTQLGNRRALRKDLDQLEARVGRYGHRYCLALFDVDHFKSYNDTYGHQAGDLVLQAVAAAFSEQTRGGDALYRYGGEEFLCILPEQALDTGMKAVQRMRLAVERLALPHDESPCGVVTVSAGLAEQQPGVVKTTSEVLKEADDALYRAKELGRNRVEHVISGSRPRTMAGSTGRTL